MIEGPLDVSTAASTFEHVDMYLVARQRTKSKGRHKPSRVSRHHHEDIETAILEPSQYFGGLVAGNAAGDPEGDGFFHGKELAFSEQQVAGSFRNRIPPASLRNLRPGFGFWPPDLGLGLFFLSLLGNRELYEPL